MSGNQHSLGSSGESGHLSQSGSQLPVSSLLSAAAAAAAASGYPFNHSLFMSAAAAAAANMNNNGGGSSLQGNGTSAPAPQLHMFNGTEKRGRGRPPKYGKSCKHQFIQNSNLYILLLQVPCTTVIPQCRLLQLLICNRPITIISKPSITKISTTINSSTTITITINSSNLVPRLPR